MSGPGGEGRTTIHLVVPDVIDDPRHPSGGNVYDRELSVALSALGWPVREHHLRGGWNGAAVDQGRLARVLADVPDGEPVIVDGLLGLDAPDVLPAEGGRVPLHLLVHLPLGLAAPDRLEVRHREQEALSVATAVIATSDWARAWLLDTYPLPDDRVHVARPGAPRTPLSLGTADGGELLCVGAVVPAKGQDHLVDALATLRELDWTCRIMGPVDRDPAYADRIRTQIRRTGLGNRVDLTGPVRREEIRAAYGAADLLVAPTLMETYGMTVAEALAAGLPVIASEVGGVGEALGVVGDGARPGILVRLGDPAALAEALRRWLLDDDLRRRLRRSARERRALLPDWSDTARHVLHAVCGSTPPVVATVGALTGGGAAR